MMKMFMKNKKGFTLVELMVVVVIMGILVAIAVPIYGNVTDAARQRAVEADCRIVVSAVQMYQANNGGSLPTQDSDITPFLEGGALPADTTCAYAADGSSVTVTSTDTKDNTITTSSTITD